MRVTSKGQVTIPQAIRDHAGLEPGTEVAFTLGDDGTVRVQRRGDGTALNTALKRLRGAADTKLTTDEIMALTRE